MKLRLRYLISTIFLANIVFEVSPVAAETVKSTVEVLNVFINEPRLLQEQVTNTKLADFIKKVERIVVVHPFQDENQCGVMVYITLYPTKHHDSRLETDCEEDLKHLSTLSTRLEKLQTLNSKTASISFRIDFGLNGRELIRH